MSFSNWPIILKILSLPTALGLLAMFAALFASSNIDAINDQYARILDGPEVAREAISDADKELVTYARDAFRLATALTDQEIEHSNGLIKVDKDRLEAKLALAVKADPDHASDYEQLTTVARNAMDVTCGRMIELSQSSDPASVAAATAEMNSVCEPALVSASGELQKYNDQLDASLVKAQKAASDQASRTQIMSVGIILGGLVAILLIGVWVNLKGLIRPLKGLIGNMEAMSKGSLDVAIGGLERRDEIGLLARTAEAFRKGLSEAETVRSDAEKLKAQAETDRRAAMVALAGQFEASVGGIVRQVAGAATEMQAAATQLTASAHEASAQSQAVSVAAEEAGANVTSVASSAEELGASVHEIGRQVETSAGIAHSALAQADAAAAVVGELSEVANEIGGVIDLIAGLAGQTNLLALNATIESARAGEAGKGFAVVAAEVKTLAAQTSKATTDISSKITRIQDATDRTVTAMKGISNTIAEINGSSQAISSAVEQQSAATKEIVEAVHQASVGTQEVTGNIAGVASAAEQTGAAAAQVESASGELAEQAERLHREMDQFLNTIRAA